MKKIKGNNNFMLVLIFNRSSNFERIFPLRNNWNTYSKYFECEGYNDCLLWKYLSSEEDILKKYRTNYCDY